MNSFLSHPSVSLTQDSIISERVVSPSAIGYLVVKLRLNSPIAEPLQDDEGQELDVYTIQRRVKRNDEQEEEFFRSRGDAEEVKTIAEYARAPHLPGVCFVSLSLFRAHTSSQLYFKETETVLTDEKSNRVVVPPLKITYMPKARLPHADADEAHLNTITEHTYKIQFQSSPNVGIFTWKVYVISDTFVGGEVTRDITISPSRLLT